MSVSNDERLLIQKLIQNDEKALYFFYHTFQPLVFHFLRAKLPEHTAEEIAHDVLLDFIEELRDFRGDASIRTFLCCMARNKMVDFFRKKKIKSVLFSSLPVWIVENIASYFLNDDLEKKELAVKIKNVFMRLPNEYQLILRLKYVEGEKVKMIAQKLSVSLKGAESKLFRARHAFVKLFQTLP